MENKRRLIDANVLQKKFEGLKEKDGHATGRNAYDLCAMLTEDAPTVDAVEVVRCKDCEHCQHLSERCPDDITCTRLHIDAVHLNSFCSYGERKKNG